MCNKKVILSQTELKLKMGEGTCLEAGSTALPVFMPLGMT
jgi:hypothetical protein